MGQLAVVDRQVSARSPHPTPAQTDPGLPKTHLPGANPTASLLRRGPGVREFRPQGFRLRSAGKPQLMKTKAGELGLVFIVGWGGSLSDRCRLPPLRLPPSSCPLQRLRLYPGTPPPA